MRRKQTDRSPVAEDAHEPFTPLHPLLLSVLPGDQRLEVLNGGLVAGRACARSARRRHVHNTEETQDKTCSRSPEDPSFRHFPAGAARDEVWHGAHEQSQRKFRTLLAFRTTHQLTHMEIALGHVVKPSSPPAKRVLSARQPTTPSAERESPCSSRWLAESPITERDSPVSQPSRRNVPINLPAARLPAPAAPSEAMSQVVRAAVHAQPPMADNVLGVLHVEGCVIPESISVTPNLQSWRCVGQRP